MERITEGRMLVEARRILAELSPQYTEQLKNIRFDISRRMTRAAGKAIYRGGVRTVRLSYAFYADPKNFHGEIRPGLTHFQDTVIHELAHHAAGFENRHNFLWEMTARSMGGTGLQYHALELAQGFQRRRKASGGRVSCPRCGQPMDLGPTRLKRAQADLAAGKKVRYRHARCPRPGF